jgi:hypothetical protein
MTQSHKILAINCMAYMAATRLPNGHAALSARCKVGLNLRLGCIVRGQFVRIDSAVRNLFVCPCGPKRIG